MRWYFEVVDIHEYVFTAIHWKRSDHLKAVGIREDTSLRLLTKQMLIEGSPVM